MGEKVSNDNLDESAKQIDSTKFIYAPRDSLYRS